MIVLLCGSNKSTQARDIEQARFLAEQWTDCVMTTEIFCRYDQACDIKVEEDIAAYMDAVMDDGGDDPAYVARALGSWPAPAL
ncbi:hypothetical protein ACFQ4K_11200 [Tistrella bauzanensis]